MSSGIVHTERELDLVQWSYVLSLEGIAEVFIQAQGEALEEWAATPRWRLFKRRRLDREWKAIMRLFTIARCYANEQSGK